MLFATSQASAAGFAIGEQGAAALGTGGAATARSDLGETGFYNPAGWGFARQLNISVGGAAIKASIAHISPEDDQRTEAITTPETPPYVHVGVRLADFALGFSFDVPFGSGLEWPSDWRGRFDVTSIRLEVFEFAGNVVWRAHDNFAIAAGPRFLPSAVKYGRQIDAVDVEGRVNLAGTARGFGGQISALYRPTDKLGFGLNYRSRVRLAFTGQANFEEIPIELQQKAHDQRVTTELTLPDRIALGAAWQIGAGILSLDAIYWTWSTFEVFGIEFEDADTPDVADKRDWHDSITLRVGWEQRDLIDHMALRAGLAFDQTPSPTHTLSPSLPDGSRLMPTLGVGYTFSNYLLGDTEFNLAYAYAFFMGATATGPAFPADYDAGAHILSLGINYAVGDLD